MVYRPSENSLSFQHLLSRLFQATIGAILVVGVVTLTLSVIVNAAIALGVTFVPAVLRRDYRLSLDPWMTLWITGALFLHTVGMLGLYRDVWWYDHMTHTLSATIVAGVGYVTARAVDEWSDAIYLPPRFMSVYVLLFTLGFGVFWEVTEFVARIGADLLGLEAVLIQYGLEDTLLDLLFDAVGAVIVAMFGTGLVSTMIDTLAARIGDHHDGTHDGVRDDPAAGRTTTRGGDESGHFGGFVSDGPANARASWAVTVFLGAVAIGGVFAGAILAAIRVGVVLALALLPALAYRDHRATLPWPVLGLASLPVFGTVIEQPWLTSNLVTYVAVATVALVIAVELNLFTAVRMSPRFAVVFVVVTTMATAGLWALGRWFADLSLGTELLLQPGYTDAEIETALMWEFLHAVVAGVVAGIVFEWGFRRREE
ncbi:hypothetical protein [Natrinema salaciae]|uniref:Uncharacterized protein n=1 Tax=Natrinema salaciae TaxID=1186196 RepID=A0A1H9NK64_9EURY|nr:hypothetical protein [Natrinema salaciae]SER36328.1 hypothetical protein SAMN04489841_3634 [Natrinema salaciae]